MCILCFFFFLPDFVAFWDSNTPYRPACEGVSYCVEISPPSWLPPQDMSLSLTLLSLLCLLYFVPFWRDLAAFLGVWCPLPVFRSCSVEVTQHSKDLLRNLWGRKWSPHPDPLPSSHFMAENEELKSLLIKVKEESEKIGLKLNIQKNKIMASGPITSWQIDGETMDFIFLGSKITVDGDFSHEIKRCLLIGRKAMTNLDSILKTRDITLATKVHLIKAMVFPVVKYGCESWTIKKAEHQWIDAFELWCCRRLLRVRWTARRSNQSILKEISLEYSLEGLMLKLKFL